MRLAALSTTGELPPDERSMLEAHLSHCEECRNALHEYEHVVANVLSVLAAGSATEPILMDDHESWSLEEAERRLMRAVDQEPPPSIRARERRFTSTRQKLLSTVAIAVAGGTVVFVGLIGGFHVWIRRGSSEDVHALSPAVSTLLAPASLGIPKPNNIEGSRDSTARIEALLKKLEQARGHELDLQNQVHHVESELAQRDQELTDNTAERANLLNALSSEKANTEALQERLATAMDSAVRESAHRASLQTEVASLNALVDSKNHIIADDQQLLQHDRDIRNLIGAPNLYIADIQDVGENGKTRKPFGRLFYTRDRSLIFYGFDLDRQPGLKETTVFQAWGRRDANTDVNLGIFYRDDTNQRRWILKFNDAETLARLDSVFVTAEPHGGSAKPTGKPLLSTYLRLPANHP